MSLGENNTWIDDSNQDYLLTIFIPTFNGENTIERAITSVIKDIESSDLIGVVNVVVADNASADNTRRIIGRIASKKPWVKVFRLKENQGLDNNLRLGMEISNSRFVKILCDDDVLAEGFTLHLLKILNNNPNTDLIINSMRDLAESNPDLSEYSAPGIVKSHGDSNILEITNGVFGQLSTLCFKTESWFEADASSIIDGYKFHGMEFLARVYHLAIFGTCVWDDSRLMFNDLGPKRWYRTYYDLFLVNASHALFIFQMAAMNPSTFPNKSNWINWIQAAKKSYNRQLTLDLLNLRRNRILVNEESVIGFLPQEFSSGKFQSLLLIAIDRIPIAFCTLVIRAEYVLGVFLRFMRAI
jgi:glycosyltransferase involved in cell wall biosynthesis